MKAQVNPNVANLMLAAKALGPLKERVVFVGGATAALYVDPKLQLDARPTVDVDCVVEVASRVAYQKLEEQMRALGFSHDMSEGAPICRWVRNGLVVDLMPTDEKILGFSNSWYTDGVAKAEEFELPNGDRISIFSFEYFVASKCEALLSRGMKDLVLSQDLEDILFVMDGRTTFFDDLKSSSQVVQVSISKAFEKLSRHVDFESAVRGNMPRGLSLERQNFLMGRLRGASV